ncbi:TOMM precursor leader peptide-binding protein [Thermopolyspora sp. NPDC052614]|uniref:TOMM precursor leader peptide-binding protein n=1 Tax=Thermopolyspora sp. NPDC052614 TaxID=3155682 RepID=UPI003418E34E
MRVLGDGALGAVLADRLRPYAQPEGEPDLLVTVGASADAPGVAVPGVSEHGRPATPWLPVRVDFGTVVIGPADLPGEPGCPACAATRAAKARADERERRSARDRFPDRFGSTEVRLTRFGLAVAADLVADELTRLHRLTRLHQAAAARTRRGLIRLRLDTLATSVHTFLPEPRCPRCGDLPPDTAEAALIRLRPRPKPAADVHRVSDLRSRADELVRTYVDGEVGLVRGLYRSAFDTFPTTSAPMGLTPGGTDTEMGFGRDLDFHTAQLTAIAEAVERHGGLRPRGKRTVVRGSYRQLAPHALDPTTLGLYPDHWHDRPGFYFQRYHQDLVMNWVWGHSFARGGPILVPETYAYYRMHAAGEGHGHGHAGDHETADGPPPDRPFVYEISNGCALGGCLEEAILHGILELAERDAFLLTWYARLPARRLDLGTAADPRIPLMAERLRREHGYEVHVFDTTTEHGIPSVWAMVVHPGGEDARGDGMHGGMHGGMHDDIRPKTLCAAGASFSPEKAIANALLELAPLIPWQRDTLRRERERVRAMLADPDQVTNMHDHSLVNAHPDAFSRLEFLFTGDKPEPIADSFADCFRPRNHDLSADLRATVDRYLLRGQDVVVVNQTGPEHVAGGFACVKVIIPGLLPMTFGHPLRRIHGLPRLFEVPRLLGHTGVPTRPEDLNPHPHPFP